MPRRRTGRVWWLLGALILGVVALVYAFPLYWLLATALKSEAELYQATPSLFPHEPTLGAFSSVLVTRGFFGLLKNSVVVCGATVLITLALGFAITYLVCLVFRECLDHVLILSEAHLRRLLRAYGAYYNTTRPHQSLERNSPQPQAIEPPPCGRIIAIPQVGGLHHRYQCAA
jgi:ABC-type spermidine/putrescine transport system permease subunit I